jgi:hypothetical protein
MRADCIRHRTHVKKTGGLDYPALNHSSSGNDDDGPPPFFAPFLTCPSGVSFLHSEVDSPVHPLRQTVAVSRQRLSLLLLFEFSFSSDYGAARK